MNKSPKPIINYLFDDKIFDAAKALNLIPSAKENEIYFDWKYGKKDIDELLDKPVRLILCSSAMREWRDTMLWRSLYFSQMRFIYPMYTTIADLEVEDLWDIVEHYECSNQYWLDTVWGKEFVNELVRRGEFDAEVSDKKQNNLVDDSERI
jgi:hypothetical protein